VFVLRHTCPDAEQATAAGQARLDQLARSHSTVSVTLAVGNPRLRSQTEGDFG